MKIARILFMCTLLMAFNSAYTQVTEAEGTLKTQNADTTKGWKTGGVVAINLAQTSLTNWAAGGENSIAVNGMLSVFANYKKGNNAWDNSLDIGYGIIKQGDQDIRKSDDRIDFLSKYGRKATKNLYYAVLFNMKTQMDIGYNYVNDSTKIKISNHLAPAYLVAAIGFDYKPNAWFSAFLAPVTSKTTIVTDQDLANAGAFGVDPAKYNDSGVLLEEGANSKTEFGGYLRIIYSRNDFKSEFLKNVSFTTKIDLFSNYLENPQNVDVNWETLIALKVNKYISVNVNTQLIYDDNIKIAKEEDGVMKSKPRTQFKEILGVGFSYKF